MAACSNHLPRRNSSSRSRDLDYNRHQPVPAHFLFLRLLNDCSFSWQPIDWLNVQPQQTWLASYQFNSGEKNRQPYISLAANRSKPECFSFQFNKHTHTYTYTYAYTHRHLETNQRYVNQQQTPSPVHSISVLPSLGNCNCCSLPATTAPDQFDSGQSF